MATAKKTQKKVMVPKPKSALSGVPVVATKQGYYGLVIIHPGEKFMLAKEEDFSEHWMKALDAHGNVIDEENEEYEEAELEDEFEESGKGGKKSSAPKQTMKDDPDVAPPVQQGGDAGTKDSSPI